MKKESTQGFFAFLVLSLSLISCVPLADILFSITFIDGANLNEPVSYSNKEMYAGIVSETLRALITVYLYATTKNRGISILHSIKFGLLYSALIASLYIVLGAFYFQTKNPLKFILVDSFILFIQGILSGLILYSFYKQKNNNEYQKH